MTDANEARANTYEPADGFFICKISWRQALSQSVALLARQMIMKIKRANHSPRVALRAKLLRGAQPGLSLRRLIFQNIDWTKMKHCRLRLLKFLVCLAALIGTQAGSPVAAAPAAENLRYLFLIDHSPEMAMRQIATVETI